LPALWGTVRRRLETNAAGTIPMAATVCTGLAGAAGQRFAAFRKQRGQWRNGKQEDQRPAQSGAPQPGDFSSEAHDDVTASISQWARAEDWTAA